MDRDSHVAPLMPLTSIGLAEGGRSDKRCPRDYSCIRMRARKATVPTVPLLQQFHNKRGQNEIFQFDR
jgi:hypothetical protein